MYCSLHVCLSVYLSVCLSVCPLTYVRSHTYKFHQIFTWLSPLLTAMQYVFTPSDNVKPVMVSSNDHGKASSSLSSSISWLLSEQGVAVTGRNRTGPPCSVGRPTAHARSHRRANRPRARRQRSHVVFPRAGGRLACPPAALQTTYDDYRRQRAKQY